MDAFYIATLILLIGLIILTWLFSIFGTALLMTRGDSGSSRLSVAGRICGLVAADLALPVLLTKAILLMLQIAGIISDVSVSQVESGMLPTLGVLLGLALVVCTAGIILKTREYFLTERAKANRNGEGFWISRHSDG